MTDSAPGLFTPWVTFYVMTGTAAASLTGLMFVVITLVTQIERLRKNPDGISTYSTPTVVHFCVALFVSAVLAVPWHALAPATVLLALAGLYGLVYVVRVTYRSARLTAYRPDLEDWAWYSVLPFVGYGALLAGAIALLSAPQRALFALAGGVVVLIFCGIRNAWDVVTFLVVGGGDQPPS